MTEASSGLDDISGIVKAARKTISIEIEGLEEVRSRLDDNFARAVRKLFNIKGRVIVTGIGKSGLVGRKIAATLASTGTPAIFMHPVEAMHGDLGMVLKQDAVIAISNSGETGELCALLPVFRERGVPVIALTGRPDSTLGKSSEFVIDTGVPREACSLGLAPTASTTAVLAVGDAIAVALLGLHRFNERDFRRNHPSGSLGERLKVSVGEVMITGEGIPGARPETALAELLEEMDAKGMGAVLVLNGDESLAGIITDGDLRRAMRKGLPEKCEASDIMSASPKFVHPDARAADALELMERHLITVLPVLEKDGRIAGIVHLHDLLGKGNFSFTL
jgi:arabinose-5-phosphate isomerase